MRILIALLIALLIGTNCFWLYRDFDRSVTEGYRQQELYENANRLVAVSTLASEFVRGKPKTDVDVLLRKLFPQEVPFEKEGAIHATWISLPISADGFVRGIEVDPGTKLVATRNAVRGVVGNEVFYPSLPASSAPR